MSICATASETQGVVVRVERSHVWIEASQASCGQCTGQGACGSGLLGLRVQPRTYRLPNTIDARVGDVVVLTAARGKVLSSALLAYAMPLGLGLLGAGAATMSGGGDGQAALGLFAGIFVGWLLLRRLSTSREPNTTITLEPQAPPAPRLIEDIRQ